MTGFLILAFLILVAGVLAVPLATRLGLGSVLGYLLAGMAISPLLAALSVDVEALQVFAEFGVVMMLFIIGLEMDPKRLWEMRGKLAGLGGGQVVLTTLVLTGVALLADQPWQTALAIGMVLALSSTAIIVQTLTEKGLMRTQGGEASFSVLLVQDVAVIPILALVPLLALPELASLAAGHGEGGAHGGIDLTAHMSIWLAAATRIAAVAAVIAIGIFAIRPLFRYIARANLRELFTAAALVVVIGIALLMSLVGLSPALGAFIAGVVLATSEYRHELESDINPFKGLLLGLFFITVGAGIDFGLAATIWDSVLFWAAVTIAAKMAVLLIVGWLYGLRKQALWLFCLSLPQAGEFAFVLIAFGVANAVFAPQFAAQLLLIVALTMLVTPLLFILYDKLIAHAYCAGQGGREADAIEEENPIIIAGRGRVGGIVDRMLDASGHRATVIDYNSDHLEVLKKFGVSTYYGDATRPDLLASAGIERARILVVALDEREQIDKLVRYACANFPDLHVVARAKDRDHVYHLWAMGCRDIVRETYDSSLRMGRSVYEALGYDRQAAIAMVEAFETMDRTSMREVADTYRLDIPAYENEELLAKIRELKAEWDPKLREAMDEIAARGR
ncbi:monovalent cation:proton antiporter-2 (CPA2) family protein [Qipengyuania flava]|uniref:monovalent cation:proton antiporter-2 (CPA2) family protein n=1 Tax=Qipengyuania flava TaxID=192812 RepID=UPI001C56CA88|nr:monovalent cation:proton antiporter-2 (CPA2) family protein [Qipengyuania flava]MBW3168409.1 monovalent cation:proton antiporter-2 (CPA2) family protein [Qipengyuania flava]MBY5965647.1 monovalent cation:proton antiporter-2 (CPA2) family protein [Qipengyuania flava]MBY6011971.1 monovalent cation:proton antiporter-2 (CPA2) family protein [Qipengyuania flava]MBY6026413.1 monovalent cation:proton antiporter-2 (CPA2) family protein [Qipengyuania flava]